MKRILFVEDDALVARIYSRKLAEEGYEVEVAEDGLVAVKRLMESFPDLVVLDLVIPRLSGADVLRFMRQQAVLAKTPVVVLSNWYLGKLVEQVLALKIQGSLAKSSATPAQLKQLIRELLEGPHGSTATEAAAPRAAPVTPPPPTDAWEQPDSAREKKSTPPKESEAEFRTRIQREFLQRIPEVFDGARRLCGELIETTDSPAPTRLLEDLARKVGFVTQMTAMAGFLRAAELAGALEALLYEVRERPNRLNDSCRHTIVSTVAFLADSLVRVEPAEKPEPATPATVMVVDDDAVTNRAVVAALSRAKLTATSVTDPTEALGRLEQTACDLVLLDIDMPGMDGLELCQRIRELPLHKRTPVIFVTMLTDFKTRARAILNCGNDLIAKPVLPAELCVKVLTHLLKGG